MADNSKVEWCDATWNVITGCSVASPACTNCYAMRLSGTRLKDHPSRKGLTKIVNGKPVWTGDVRFNEEWLTQPLKWRKPRKIFVCAHGDLFHENVPDEWINEVFAVMAMAPRHTFMVLTKRAARMRRLVAETGDKLVRYRETGGGPLVEALGSLAARLGIPRETAAASCLPYIDPTDGKWPLQNVMLGVTAEDQPRADERIPDLLATPAVRRFVSIEPMIGPVNLCRIAAGHRRVQSSPDYIDALTGEICEGHGEFDGMFDTSTGPALNLIICGGESGPGSRPMHPAWPRALRDQCNAAGVAFFFKQWGEWVPISFDDLASEEIESEELAGRIIGFEDQPMHRVGKRRAGRLLDGVEHNGE